MIFVQGTIRAASSDLEALVPVISMMVEKSNNEEGCLHYSFAKSLTEPDVIHITERWKSEDDLNAHFQTTHMAEFNAAISAVTIEAADVRMYSGEEVRVMIQS